MNFRIINIPLVESDVLLRIVKDTYFRSSDKFVVKISTWKNSSNESKLDTFFEEIVSFDCEESNMLKRCQSYLIWYSEENAIEFYKSNKIKDVPTSD